MSAPWPPITGTAKATGAEGLTTPAPLVVWASAASIGNANRSVRGLSDELLRLGPESWARDHVATKLVGKGFTHVIIGYPGGQEPDGSDLRFDMLDRARSHSDPRVQACGDLPSWYDAIAALKEITNLKVGMYVGTGELMKWPDCHDHCLVLIDAFAGMLDFVVLDTLGDRPMGSNDQRITQHLFAGGFEMWGEPRATEKAPTLPITYLCDADKWNGSGGQFGDKDHRSLAAVRGAGGTVVIFDQRGTMGKNTADNYRAQGVGVCVGVDRVPIVGGVA